MSFVRNEQEFKAAKLHWANEFDIARLESASALEVTEDDSPFYVLSDDIEYAEVFHIESNTKYRRGVSVTQWLPDPDCPDFVLVAWIQGLGDPAYPDEIVEYLRFNCVLTAESSRLFRMFVKAWLFDNLTSEEVENLIEREGCSGSQLSKENN